MPRPVAYHVSQHSIVCHRSRHTMIPDCGDDSFRHLWVLMRAAGGDNFVTKKDMDKTEYRFDSVVAETLLIPLYFRAKESRRGRHALLRDETGHRVRGAEQLLRRSSQTLHCHTPAAGGRQCGMRTRHAAAAD